MSGILAELESRRERRARLVEVIKPIIIDKQGICWPSVDDNTCVICMGRGLLLRAEGGWRKCWCTSMADEIVDEWLDLEPGHAR